MDVARIALTDRYHMGQKVRWFLMALDVLIVAVYGIHGMRLYNRAYDHLKDPDSGPVWMSNVWGADKFTDEGNRLRRVAFRFYIIGGCFLVVYFLTVSWLLKA